MVAAEEARALIGIEYGLRVSEGEPAQGQRITSRLSCTREGGGILYFNGVDAEDWTFGWARCRGRYVAMLTRWHGKENGNPRWRIVDTVLLPRFEWDVNPKRPHARHLFMVGDCHLDGRIDTFFIATLRLGHRDEVDWRTGVERAWGFDVERGRIVPISTRRVVCYRPDEP